MLAKQLLITVWLCLVVGTALPGQAGQPAVRGQDQKVESQAEGGQTATDHSTNKNYTECQSFPGDMLAK